MSQSSIDRWNAIPLSRTDQRTASLKHPHNADNDNDNDDDVSLASRSPSPPTMDVDKSLDKYDEYVRGVAREVITIETKIKPSNKGFAMLRKLGWNEGQPLGTSGQGRVDPIPFQIKTDSTGLGKINQDVKMIETTVSQRREMDSERQQKETEDQRRAREELVARKSALKDEISSTLKAFYCTLCDKQFQNVAQYDEHTNSYAHHHKARFKDMQANVRLKPKDEVNKRKEKERKREEKELRKIAAANGIKMAKPTAAPLAHVVGAASTTPERVVSAPSEAGGRATMSGTLSAGPSNPGWRSVGVAPVLSQSTPLPQELSTDSRSKSKSAMALAFRTGGWTSLDNTDSQIMSPPSMPDPPQPPPLPTVPTPDDHLKAASTQSFIPNEPPSLPPAPSAEMRKPSQEPRNNWQQFKSNVRRR